MEDGLWSSGLCGWRDLGVTGVQRPVLDQFVLEVSAASLAMSDRQLGGKLPLREQHDLDHMGYSTFNQARTMSLTWNRDSDKLGNPDLQLA